MVDLTTIDAAVYALWEERGEGRCGDTLAMHPETLAAFIASLPLELPVQASIDVPDGIYLNLSAGRYHLVRQRELPRGVVIIRQGAFYVGRIDDAR